MQPPLLALLARVAQRRGGAAATIPTSSSSFARATLATSCSPRAPAAATSSTANEEDAAPTPSTASAAEARSALRALLRSVDAHFTSVAANAQWRDFVLEQARSAAKGKDASSLVSAARDYVSLIENVAKHRALLREYNLGLDPDERNRQMVEKTAARVGFSIPKGKEEEAGDGEGGGDDAEEAGRGSIARRAAAARAAAAAAGGGTGGATTTRKGRRG